MNLKKIISALLSVCLVSVHLPVYTAVTQTVCAQQENNSKFSAAPAYGSDQTYNEDHNIMDMSENIYPASFDLREQGLVSSIKNQGDYGTCWVFSAIAAIESSLMKTDPLIDLSENHLAIFSFYGSNSIDLQNGASYFTVGGHPNYVVSTLSQWKGPVSETVSPYAPDSEEINPELEYLSQYHLKNADMLNEYSLSRIYPDDLKILSVNQIKESLLNQKSVTVDFSYDTSGGSYNQNTYSQYSNYRGTPNHSVLIVGWDDNYSSDNFISHPSGNGAWLAKNSWGNDWGDNGYFWISYFDKSLSNTTSYEFEAADNYSDCYQHDTLAYTASVCADNTDRNTSYMANIFTAQEDTYITAAGLYTTDNNAQYELSVYSDLSDPSDPVSGLHSNITKGSCKYAGYHVIDLNDPVCIKKGQKFSIVARLTNPDKPYPVPVEAAVILCENGMSANVGGISKEKIKSSSDYGESFISSNGTKWTDTKGLKIETAYDSLVLRNKNIAYYPGNVCLKAFTNNDGYIHFSMDEGKVAYGSEISLSSPFSDKIYYTTDGSVPDEKSMLYSEPVKITSDTTINACIDPADVSCKVFTKKYTQAQSVLSSLTINDSPLDVVHDGKVNTVLSYSIDDTSDSIVLSPIGTGTITINGQKIVSGHKTPQIHLTPGENTIKIISQQEGMTTTEYTLSVNKNYAAVDYYNEVIVFDESIATVTSKYGHVFHNGESISGYLGQALTVKADQQLSELITAPRLDLSAEIDPVPSYRIEVLSDIFSLSYQMRFSFNSDMSDSRPITSRIYPMLSNNCFKIYPETDRNLYFQIPANNDSPASTVLHISLPDRTHINDDALEYGITDDNKIFFTVADAVKKKTEYIAEVKTSKELSYTSQLPINLSTQCTNDTTYIDNVIPGQTYMVYITCINDPDTFTSYVKSFEITVPGDTPDYSFNYRNETIIFDEDKYTAKADDGTSIGCYDNISDYIGKTITLTDKEQNKTIVKIPARPVLDDIETDYKKGRITNLFSTNVKYTKTLAFTGYTTYENSISSLCDSEGIVWINKIYESSAEPGDILHFYIDATENSFKSVVKDYIVPVCPKISQFRLNIQKFTDTQIFLEPDDQLEYGIKTKFSREFQWQDSSVFSDLTPSSVYIIAVRTRSTETKLYSQPVVTIIKTLPEEFLYGDLDDNSLLSVTDLLIMKKIVLTSVKPDSQQKRAGDMNTDGTINVFDYIRLANDLLRTQ